MPFLAHLAHVAYIYTFFFILEFTFNLLKRLFLDFRLQTGRKLNEGILQEYVNGVWLPVCTKRKLWNITVTDYCQKLGYANGIQIFNNVGGRNNTNCQFGRELIIRCHTKRM